MTRYLTEVCFYIAKKKIDDPSAGVSKTTLQRWICRFRVFVWQLQAKHRNVVKIDEFLLHGKCRLNKHLVDTGAVPLFHIYTAIHNFV